MDEHILALDLGGTNCRFGVVSRTGTIVARRRKKTPRLPGPELAEFLVDQLKDVLAKLPGAVKVTAVAAAVPAIIDTSNAGDIELPNIPELGGVDLAKILRDGLAVPVFLENDATAATIGEHWRGASVGLSNVVGVTLGTGVGGGLIIGGSPYRGASGSAGEVGHICVEPDGLPCGCGSRGCLEQYASGTAIIREARSAGFNVRNSFEVYELFARGDEKITAVFDSVGRYLGIALAALVNVLNPDAIVIGGGVAGSWDAFHEPLMREMNARSFNAPWRRVKVLRARLGDDAGILGAARTAWMDRDAAERRCA